MKCSKCGRNIGVEVKICPYCNSVNTLAAKHDENIRQYDKKIENTRAEVLESSKKTKGLWIRAILLAVLIAGIMIMEHQTDRNYHGPDMDAIKERDALEHTAEYTEAMDRYLKEGDYVELAAFIYSHEIPFGDDDYHEYISVNYCVSDYYECIRHMEAIVLRSRDEDYYDSLESEISSSCRYLQAFMKTYEAQREREKNSEYLACIEDMYQDIRAMLRTYMDMSDEETDEFLELSETGMAVRMEEVFGSEAE